MKKLIQRMLVAMTLCAFGASAQSAQRSPHIGYVYPGGGRQGSTFQVLVGGQFLDGVTDVHITGEGVHATLIKKFRPLRNLNREQRVAINTTLLELSEKRWAELAKKGKVDPNPPWKNAARRHRAATDAANTEAVKLPDHYILYDLENKSLRELLHVREMIFNTQKRQLNVQIAETVLIKVTVDRGAAPGNRELRLVGRAGLTNPMVFQVGTLPEMSEVERNDPTDFDPLPREPPVDLPVVMNGQILPGDVDRFRFLASGGQQLVIEADARALIPYLADAVPGWFQATLSLYDSRGHEVAFADDYRFDPDPVLFYTVPEDGEYELEIRDSIYRGREDFVYRITVGEQSFITRMFPLGGRTGRQTTVSIDGWNLRTKRLPLDTRPGVDDIRQKALSRGKSRSNSVMYAVDRLPGCEEAEPNNTHDDALRIPLPRIVNGRIAHPGDVDTFQFKGRAGDEIVAEVTSRRLGSPLDSLLRLTDASGRVLEWNDDYQNKDGYLHTDMGLITHHADSYLSAILPTDGVYFVEVRDAQSHGGESYCYRLRIGPPQPDFELRMAPSSINVPAGRSAPIDIYVLRKDGFDDEIELVLIDAPRGFKLDGPRIPAGYDHVRMTLSVPTRRLNGPIALTIEGRATIARRTVSRPVRPSEDMMQAFLYRHLTPSQELMVAVLGGRGPGPVVERDGLGPVRIPAGGKTLVRINVPPNPRLQELELELDDPPPGITLGDITVIPDGLEFQLKAASAVQAGFTDNLIVEIFIHVGRPTRDGKAPQQTRRVSLGVLPAIPVEIVQR